MTERFATATGTLPAVPPATRRGRVGVFVRIGGEVDAVIRGVPAPR